LRLFRILLLSIVMVTVSTGSIIFPSVAARWAWDSSTKVTLGERSYQGPAVVWDPGLVKTFMAWTGIDSSHSLNVISSSDMKTWSNKVTLSLGASTIGQCVDSLDMVYYPTSPSIYIAYNQVDTTFGWCNANHIYVIYSNDGTSFSPPCLVTSTPVCTNDQGCASENQMSGP